MPTLYLRQLPPIHSSTTTRPSSVSPQQEQKHYHHQNQNTSGGGGAGTGGAVEFEEGSVNNSVKTDRSRGTSTDGSYRFIDDESYNTYYSDPSLRNRRNKKLSLVTYVQRVESDTREMSKEQNVSPATFEERTEQTEEEEDEEESRDDNPEEDSARYPIPSSLYQPGPRNQEAFRPGFGIEGGVAREYHNMFTGANEALSIIDPDTSTDESTSIEGVGFPPEHRNLLSRVFSDGDPEAVLSDDQSDSLDYSKSTMNTMTSQSQSFLSHSSVDAEQLKSNYHLAKDRQQCPPDATQFNDDQRRSYYDYAGMQAHLPPPPPKMKVQTLSPVIEEWHPSESDTITTADSGVYGNFQASQTHGQVNYPGPFNSLVTGFMNCSKAITNGYRTESTLTNFEAMAEQSVLNIHDRGPRREVNNPPRKNVDPESSWCIENCAKGKGGSDEKDEQNWEAPRLNRNTTDEIIKKSNEYIHEARIYGRESTDSFGEISTGSDSETFTGPNLSNQEGTLNQEENVEEVQNEVQNEVGKGATDPISFFNKFSAEILSFTERKREMERPGAEGMSEAEKMLEVLPQTARDLTTSENESADPVSLFDKLSAEIRNLTHTTREGSEALARELQSKLVESEEHRDRILGEWKQFVGSIQEKTVDAAEFFADLSANQDQVAPTPQDQTTSTQQEQNIEDSETIMNTTQDARENGAVTPVASRDYLRHMGLEVEAASTSAEELIRAVETEETDYNSTSLNPFKMETVDTVEASQTADSVGTADESEGTKDEQHKTSLHKTLAVAKATNRRQMMMNLQRSRMKAKTKKEPETKTEPEPQKTFHTAELRGIYLALHSSIHGDGTEKENEGSETLATVEKRKEGTPARHEQHGAINSTPELEPNYSSAASGSTLEQVISNIDEQDSSSSCGIMYQGVMYSEEEDVRQSLYASINARNQAGALDDNTRDDTQIPVHEDVTDVLERISEEASNSQDSTGGDQNDSTAQASGGNTTVASWWETANESLKSWSMNSPSANWEWSTSVNKSLETGRRELKSVEMKDEASSGSCVEKHELADPALTVESAKCADRAKSFPLSSEPFDETLAEKEKETGTGKNEIVAVAVEAETRISKKETFQPENVDTKTTLGNSNNQSMEIDTSSPIDPIMIIGSSSTSPSDEVMSVDDSSLVESINSLDVEDNRDVQVDTRAILNTEDSSSSSMDASVVSTGDIRENDEMNSVHVVEQHIQLDSKSFEPCSSNIQDRQDASHAWIAKEDSIDSSCNFDDAEDELISKASCASGEKQQCFYIEEASPLESSISSHYESGPTNKSNEKEPNESGIEDEEKIAEGVLIPTTESNIKVLEKGVSSNKSALDDSLISEGIECTISFEQAPTFEPNDDLPFDSEEDDGEEEEEAEKLSEDEVWEDQVMEILRQISEDHGGIATKPKSSKVLEHIKVATKPILAVFVLFCLLKFGNELASTSKKDKMDQADEKRHFSADHEVRKPSVRNVQSDSITGLTMVELDPIDGGDENTDVPSNVSAAAEDFVFKGTATGFAHDIRYRKDLDLFFGCNLDNEVVEQGEWNQSDWVKELAASLEQALGEQVAGDYGSALPKPSLEFTPESQNPTTSECEDLEEVLDKQAVVDDKPVLPSETIETPMETKTRARECEEEKQTLNTSKLHANTQVYYCGFNDSSECSPQVYYCGDDSGSICTAVEPTGQR